MQRAAKSVQFKLGELAHPKRVILRGIAAGMLGDIVMAMVMMIHMMISSIFGGPRPELGGDWRKRLSRQDEFSFHKVMRPRRQA